MNVQVITSRNQVVFQCVLLEYCSVVWDTASANLKTKIDKVFNYSVRLIFDAKFGSPITPLLEDLHWRRLQERRDFQASKVAFKIMKKLAPSSLLTILKSNREVGVRSHRHQDNCYIPRPQSECLKKNFSYRGAQLWNNLSSALCHAPSLSIFRSLYFRS